MGRITVTIDGEDIVFTTPDQLIPSPRRRVRTRLRADKQLRNPSRRRWPGPGMRPGARYRALENPNRAASYGVCSAANGGRHARPDEGICPRCGEEVGDEW